MIDVSGTFNFRDVGGRPTGDGSMMRSGVLYRSASLDSLDEDGLQQIEALGISTVLDLRSTGEVESHGRFPYEVVPVRFIHLPSPFGPPSGEVTSANLPEFAHDEDPMAAMFRMAVTQGSEVIGQSIHVTSP